MKKVTFILMIALSIFIFAGCAPKATEIKVDANPSGTAPSEKRSGFLRPDLIGEVSVIKGDTITLKLIEMPDRSKQKRDDKKKDDKKKDSIPTQGAKTQSKANGTVNYTGKTETITIPANFAIEKSIRSDNGMKSETIGIKDVKIGEVLQLTYSDKTNKVIGSIRIRGRE